MMNIDNKLDKLQKDLGNYKTWEGKRRANNPYFNLLCLVSRGKQVCEACNMKESVDMFAVNWHSDGTAEYMPLCLKCAEER